MSNTEQDKGLFTEVFDRIRNPFLAGFVISWCIINYQFLMVAFCEESINWKIGTIEEMYPALSWAWWIKLIIGPTISSTLFRIISHAILIADQKLKVIASPILLAIDEGKFKDHITLRKEIKRHKEKYIELNEIIENQRDEHFETQVKLDELNKRSDEIHTAKMKAQSQLEDIKIKLETITTFSNIIIDRETDKTEIIIEQIERFPHIIFERIAKEKNKGHINLEYKNSITKHQNEYIEYLKNRINMMRLESEDY